MEYTHLSEFFSQNSMSQPETKLQVGPQLTLEVSAFAFLSPHHLHFSGDVKVKILWSLEEFYKEQNAQM